MKRSILIASLALLFCAGCRPEGFTLTPPPKPFMKMRYTGIVPQALDYTCGAASLATIMRHYWGRAFSEEFVLRILRARYPDAKEWQAKIQAGFSLDDLEYAAAALGFNAQSVRITTSELAKLEGPVIIHLDKGELEHFSVLRKFDGQTAFLADPIVGNRGMSLDKFNAEYTGNAMAIWIDEADLPEGTELQKVRDGMSISAVMARAYQGDTAPRSIEPLFQPDVRVVPRLN